jgi:hypothetical protein
VSWFWPTRAVEATPEQLVATGAMGGSGWDPLDGEAGWKRLGAGRREVPQWTRERAVAASVAAYRSNPMGGAIVDTYTAFCVGDSGVSYQCTNPDVQQIVAEFWDDPRNRIGAIQDIWLRSQLLLGELPIELMQGAQSGVVRINPMDPMVVRDVTLEAGNPLWPDDLVTQLGDSAEERRYQIVRVNDATGLREGQAMFWAPWKTLVTDTRGMPFLTSILDWLDNYDMVLSNLIDRTALARYFMWDVTVTGGQTEVDNFVRGRGGLHTPPSASVEVHNESVVWKAQSVPTGAAEDTQTNSAVLTNIAGGAGLAKTWLAEPDGANRATSLTMAEPVRRRVGAVQKLWLDQQAELLRFVVDRAVAAGRLPSTVEATDPKSGATYEIPAAQSVMVTGPEIAAADAQITAQVLLNLSTGLEKLVQIGALTEPAAAQAARKAWEDYMGVPYKAELDSPTASPDDVAQHVDDASKGGATVIPLGPAQESRGARRGAVEHDGTELHRYWTQDPAGLKKWVGSDHPWETLHSHLAEFIHDPGKLDRTTSAWFIDVFHFAAGSDLNRVTHGHPPRGKRVGPG